MDFSQISINFLSAPVLFFFLGLIAVFLKSDMEIPPVLAKFFSLYLLFDIGIKGGQELFRSGFSSEVLHVLEAAILMSLLVPLLAFFILKKKLNAYDAGSIAAAYGSVSAVTFATTVAYLQTLDVAYSGYMVTGLAFMESPAIIVGLFLIRYYAPKEKRDYQLFPESAAKHGSPLSFKEFRHIAHEATFNGSVLLLLGSVVIGYLAGAQGEHDLKTFVSDIYKGMLCFYLLDMGLEAGKRLGDLRKSGPFLILFAIFMPVFNAALGIIISYWLGLSEGNALLFTMLCGSASYIAVPAAMRMSVPEANMSLMLPMSLGVTFTFNIGLGIPIYHSIIQFIWG